MAGVPRWCGAMGMGSAWCLPALPELFVEVEGHGIAQRLDHGQGAADTPVAAQGPADEEGDAEVQAGKAEGLAHDRGCAWGDGALCAD